MWDAGVSPASPTQQSSAARVGESDYSQRATTVCVRVNNTEARLITGYYSEPRGVSGTFLTWLRRRCCRYRSFEAASSYSSQKKCQLHTLNVCKSRRRTDGRMEGQTSPREEKGGWKYGGKHQAERAGSAKSLKCTVSFALKSLLVTC